MTNFARAAFVTGITLFLEGFAIYLLGRLLSNAIRLPESGVPLGIAMIAIGWSFILSWYVQNIRFSLNLRGVIGLIVSALSVLVLAGVSMGAGWFPIGLVFSGELDAVAALTITATLLLLLWWRGTAIARDDVTLDVVRNAFVRGVVIVIVAVAADAIMDANIIRLPVLFMFFAIGLGGMALSRFAIDSGVGHISRGWLLAIVISVVTVLFIALILGAHRRRRPGRGRQGHRARHRFHGPVDSPPDSPPVGFTRRRLGRGGQLDRQLFRRGRPQWPGTGPPPDRGVPRKPARGRRRRPAQRHS